MKTLIRFLLVMVAVLTISAPSPAQWLQTNGPYGGIITCFAASPTGAGGTNLFAGIIEIPGDHEIGKGVFLSTNNGTSWTAVNTSLTNLYVRALAISGTNLFAATDGGVFLSTNNGTSWTAVNTGMPNTGVYALVGSGANLFAGIHNGWTPGGVFLSTNNGTSWMAVNNGLTDSHVNALAVSSNATGDTNLFAGTFSGVFLSTNKGTSWTAVNTNLTNRYVLSFAILGTNLFAMTVQGGDMTTFTKGIFLSTNNGTNWTTVNTGLTNLDVSALAVNGTSLFAATGGSGVFLSTNNGTNWTAVNTGLTNLDVSALAVTGTHIFAGTDDGVWRRPLSEIIPTTDSLSVPVAGGTFTAGTTPVTISSFKIDKYEVTYELWTAVRTWALTHGYTDLVTGKNGYEPVSANNPVDSVNWYDVVKWCNARSEKDGLTPVYYTRSAQDTVYRTAELNINVDAVKWTANGHRLPTEAEWEFASRGGNSTHGYTYSGSDTVDSVAWYYSNSDGTTHTVGIKKANELGTYDMSGNVEEWCWDWYGSAYPSGGTANPKGPSTMQSFRLLRGASCSQVDLICRVAYRNFNYPDDCGGSVGFRCVQGSQVGTAVKGEPSMLQKFGLEQNYPNPLNPSTTFTFALPQPGTTSLKVFNLLGMEVATVYQGLLQAGNHQFNWSADPLPSGVYLYRLQSGSYTATKKLILMK